MKGKPVADKGKENLTTTPNANITLSSSLEKGKLRMTSTTFSQSEKKNQILKIQILTTISNY